MEQKRTLPLKHWGFERWPFVVMPSAQQFYPTAGNTEALARLEYLVESRRRIGMLLGVAGVGKSLVLQAATRQLARKGNVAVRVDAAGAATRDLLWSVAAGLGAAPTADSDNPRLWRQIADRLAENRLQQIGTVLLVDDAGQAGPDLFSQILRLSRLEATAASRWTIVLAAEPPEAARWSPELRELVDLRVALPTWEVEETVGFVQTALVEAGRIEPLFEDGALEHLHQMAAGIPRRIVRLADNALLSGAAAGLDLIDEATVDSAEDEIAWPELAGVF